MTGPAQARVTRSVLLILTTKMASMKCGDCGHVLRNHWWWEPEFHCTVGWRRLGDPTGCKCPEFLGITWFDLMEELEP
jgi:hypothetical protein